MLLACMLNKLISPVQATPSPLLSSPPSTDNVQFDRFTQRQNTTDTSRLCWDYSRAKRPPVTLAWSVNVPLVSLFTFAPVAHESAIRIQHTSLRLFTNAICVNQWHQTCVTALCRRRACVEFLKWQRVHWMQVDHLLFQHLACLLSFWMSNALKGIVIL